MYFRNTPVKLTDSRRHGAGTELFIVEGDSAASTVAALRDGQFQAVLPMQGKPLNAIKASAEKVAAYPLFKALNESLGIDHSRPTADLFVWDDLRFERLVLLFDPDADGIHSGALMLMFVYQYLRPLLDQGRVLMIHAPWVQISLTEQQPLYAYSEAQALALTQQLRAQGKTPQVVRYRGLSGIDRAILMQTCIDPATRNARVMTEQDALAAIEIFGANA
jgi:DNA gyrase subunit B/topoisomerase-4 subunit B